MTKKTKNYFKHQIQAAYDRWICTPERLMLQSVRKFPRHARKISIAIPHYNRAALIHRPLWNIVNDERVEEIVIVDDGSSQEEFELLQNNVARYDQRKVVALYRREKNKGTQFTKMECVEKTMGPWLILLDSDNTLFRGYLEAVTSLPVLEEQTIYCPEKALPYFRFSKFLNLKMDFELVYQLTQSGVLKRSSFLNDGNYFFNKEAYRAHFLKLNQMKSDVADVMVANYYWLSHKKTLAVLKGASYLHRIDASSFWVRTSQESKARVIEIFKRLENNLRWDDDFEKKLLS